MRDKPSFDDLEPPDVVTTPIDGLTDAEWVARRERRERRLRMVLGIVLGAVVGLGAALRTFLLGSYLGAALIVGATAMLFAALLARQREGDLARHVGWLLFPESYLVEKMPWWLIAVLWLVAFALAAMLVVAVLLGFFSRA